MVLYDALFVPCGRPRSSFDAILVRRATPPDASFGDRYSTAHPLGTVVNVETEADPVVLFDGVCNLCVGSLPWLLRMDHRDRLRFGTLQSDSGTDLLEHCGLPRDYDQSMVVVEGETAYTKSDAVVRLAWLLGFPWALGSIAALVPERVRDRAYRWLARNRYDWFGTRDACLVPDSDLVDGNLRDRFLG